MVLGSIVNCGISKTERRSACLISRINLIPAGRILTQRNDAKYFDKRFHHNVLPHCLTKQSSFAVICCSAAPIWRFQRKSVKFLELASAGAQVLGAFLLTWSKYQKKMHYNICTWQLLLQKRKWFIQIAIKCRLAFMHYYLFEDYLL